MSRQLIKLDISISTSKYFATQKELAEFLGISNSSKKGITTRCIKNGWLVEFPEKITERKQVLTKKRIS